MICAKFIVSLIMSVNVLFTPITEFFERGQALINGISVSVSALTETACVVMEANTMKVTTSVNEHKEFAAGHFTKLMTLLLTAEAVENGEIDLSQTATVSKYANSMQGTQIWLDVGEEISVEELVKAITVGNANDASVVLSETVAKDEKEFVAMMNNKASELGMTCTKYYDCNGISEKNVTCAYDTALLTAELSKYEWLFKYTTTWLDNVRECKTELVNNNRLVRTYNGIIGFKAFCSEESENCLSAAAQRNEMTFICVIMGEKDKDTMFSQAKESLNVSFAANEIYVPEFEEEVLSDVSVNCGDKLTCKVTNKNTMPVLIPKGRAEDVKIIFERVELIPAPVKIGTVVGSITATLDGEVIFSSEIITAQSVEKLTMFEVYRRLLLELLNM